MVVNVQIQMKNDSWFCETHFMRQDGSKQKLIFVTISCLPRVFCFPLIIETNNDLENERQFIPKCVF